MRDSVLGHLRKYFSYNLYMRKKQFWFFIETTSFCNAQCEFCINPRLKRKKCYMSDDTFNTIIRRVLEEHIIPTGFCMHLNGEPLLDKKIVERINCIGDSFPGVTIEMTTNFKLANEYIIKQLLNSKLSTLRISLNAADEENYQKRMHLTDFNGTLENVRRALIINNSLEQKKKIIVSIVENHSNKSQVDSLKRLINEDCELITIKEGTWDREESFDCKSDRRIICDAIYKTVCILSDGSYSLCCYDAEGKTGLNISNTGIMEALKSPFYNNLRKEHLLHSIDNGICKGCSRYID